MAKRFNHLRFRVNRYLNPKPRGAEEMKLNIDDHEAVKKHIDDVIIYWRGVRGQHVSKSKEMHEMAKHYIDAWQSMRCSLFGELLQ